MLDMKWREDKMDHGLELWWKNSDAQPLASETGEIVLPLDWDEIDALISLALAYRELKSTKTRLGLPLFKEGGGGGGGNEGNEEEVDNYGGTK
jgi:hypothetical protein